MPRKVLVKRVTESWSGFRIGDALTGRGGRRGNRRSGVTAWHTEDVALPDGGGWSEGGVHTRRGINRVPFLGFLQDAHEVLHHKLQMSVEMHHPRRHACIRSMSFLRLPWHGVPGLFRETREFRRNGHVIVTVVSGGGR